MKRIIIACFSVSIIAILSGCVSSSLDDIGLESSNISSPIVSPVEQVVTAPTSLNAALTPNANSTIQSPISVTALRESGLSSGPDSNAPVFNSIVNNEFDASASSAPDRQIGLAEIRAKAEASGAIVHNINDIPSTRGKHFTVDELRLKKALLRAEAQAAQGIISENELEQKRAQIAALRRKAGSHYKQAVRQISK